MRNAPGSRTLRRVADLFGTLMEPMQLTALVLDTQGRVVYANARLLALTGRETDVFGRSWFDLFLEQPCDAPKAAFAHLLARDPNVATYTLDVLKRSGTQARVRWHNALLDDGIQVIGTASIGEVLVEDLSVTAGAADAGPAQVIDLARAAVERPDAAMLPFVKLIAEHCAQLAEERPDDAAAHIRTAFRVDAKPVDA